MRESRVYTVAESQQRSISKDFSETATFARFLHLRTFVPVNRRIVNKRFEYNFYTPGKCHGKL